MLGYTIPLFSSRSNTARVDAIPLETPHLETTMDETATSSAPLQRLHSGRATPLLPITRQHAQKSITCYDYLGRPKTHGPEQRYASPTTGACRKLTVQAVHPMGSGEHHIEDQMAQVKKLGIWLFYTSPLDDGLFFKWIGTWLLFALKLTWSLVWMILQIISNLLGVELEDQPAEDTVDFTGRYKPYSRPFKGRFWEARSRKEFSARSKGRDIPLPSPHPRVLILYDAAQGRWIPCEDRDTIIRTNYIAISCSASAVYNHGPDLEREKEDFKDEIRAAVMRENFDAYWLDLECLSDDEEKKKLDLFCMADVYCNAEKTLIVLGKSMGEDDEKTAWEQWGDRVWTFPEALLSRRLCCMFRGRLEIGPLSLSELANFAYTGQEKEQAIINAHSGKAPLERLECLSLLKASMFQRERQRGSPSLRNRSVSGSPSSSTPSPNTGNIPKSSFNEANHVYALMSFFEHRIKPDYNETETCTFARLSMANARDHITERMVSLLPSSSDVKNLASWYADDDVYSASLSDILPEVEVAGVTETGALVLDGCRASCIRWKDFPDLVFTSSDTSGSKFFGFLPSLAWPFIAAGIVSAIVVIGTPAESSESAAIFLLLGVSLLLFSPWFFVLSEGNHLVSAQPWLIGVKGVLDVDKAAMHLVAGGNKGHRFHLAYTPSGSSFAVAEEHGERAGSKMQYHTALEAERESQAGRMYTLVDTCSATVYYFSAERPPTVCLFTGRESGLGRFVLCSERCSTNELQKETVLRMPTEVSQWMDLCGWVALK